MIRPHEVLVEVSRKYRSVTSYTDRGVILWFRHGEIPDEKLFRTWYVRPGRIRLDSRDHHPYPPLRHLVTNRSICANGSRVWRWQDRPPEVEEQTEIGLAFAAAETLDVPNLLLPDEIGSFRFDQLQQIRLERTELEARRCYCLIGQHPFGTEYRVWVSEADHLIRRVRTDSHNSDGEKGSYTGVAESIYQEVEIDVPIDPKVFEHVGSLLTAG